VKCGVWKRENQPLEADEIFRPEATAGKTQLDSQMDTDIRVQLQNTVEHIRDYPENLNKHVARLQRNRWPVLARCNKPIDKRSIEVVPERDGKTNSWMRVGGTGFISQTISRTGR
jgi:hypothetical protein